MKPNSSIQTLLELATKSCEEVSVHLGKANNDHSHAMKQLEILSDYRNSYSEQLQLQMSEGLNILHYHNYQTFLLNLDKAVYQQRQTVTNKLKLVELVKKQWQACEQKRLAFLKLDERQQLAIRMSADKLEQKLNDEFSIRAQQVKR
jgi:flagellar FliJ protein